MDGTARFEASVREFFNGLSIDDRDSCVAVVMVMLRSMRDGRGDRIYPRMRQAIGDVEFRMRKTCFEGEYFSPPGLVFIGLETALYAEADPRALGLRLHCWGGKLRLDCRLVSEGVHAFRVWDWPSILKDLDELEAES